MQSQTADHEQCCISDSLSLVDLNENDALYGKCGRKIDMLKYSTFSDPTQAVPDCRDNE